MESVVAVFIILFAIAFALWLIKFIWDYISGLGKMSFLLFVIAILLTVIIFQLNSLGG